MISRWVLAITACVAPASVGVPTRPPAAIDAGEARTVAAERPDWVARLGYRPNEVFEVRRGHQGMPFIPVTIGASTFSLLLDTGNMVGLTLATPLLDELRLAELGRWDRLDASGAVVGSYRRVRAPSVGVLGRTLTDLVIYEFGDAVIGGLVGPDAMPGTRFTLDYRAGLLAVSSSRLERVPRGYSALPLTRSARLPRMILVAGRVNGRQALIELDTGASRCNIDPGLVQALNLPAAVNGVRIDSLEIGPRRFTVPSARIDSKAGLDPTLNPPVQLAVGSDILSQLVITVDYAELRLLLPDSRAP